MVAGKCGDKDVAMVWRMIGIGLVACALVGLACQRPTAADDLALARAAEAHLEWRRAVAFYQAAAQMAPNDPAPWLALAQLRWRQGWPALAAPFAAQAVRHAPRSADAWLLAGDIAAAEDHSDDADHDWRQAIAVAPATVSAQTAAHALAQQDLAAGQPDLALADAALASPAAPMLQCDAAIARLHLGDITQAQAELAATDPAICSPYRALAATWQTDGTSAAALGYADLAHDWPRLALVPLHAALIAQPGYRLGQAYLAWALWETGDVSGARTHLALADPHAAIAVGLAALLRAQTGDAAAALHLIDLWQAQHAPSLALWRIQAQIAQAAGAVAEEDDARWHLATLATGADRPAAIVALADFLLRTGLGRDDGRMAWACSQANMLAQGNEMAAEVAARCAWQASRISDAVAWAQMAIREAPFARAPHADLAAWLATLGDGDAAALEAERAADLAPDNG
jgi:tetratricopeptide (TPR) repeat protein